MLLSRIVIFTQTSSICTTKELLNAKSECRIPYMLNGMSGQGIKTFWKGFGHQFIFSCMPPHEFDVRGGINIITSSFPYTKAERIESWWRYLAERGLKIWKWQISVCIMQHEMEVFLVSLFYNYGEERCFV